MSEFRFVTLWNVEAPLAAVCDAIEHLLKWPQWWPGVEKVEELTPGDANGIGSVRRHLWKGRLTYRLGFEIRVTRMQPLTIARYDRQVRPTRSGCAC